jgi:uncharacterized membrane protein
LEGFLAIEQMKWSTQKQTRIGNVSFFGFLLMIFGFLIDANYKKNSVTCFILNI